MLGRFTKNLAFQNETEGRKGVLILWKNPVLAIVDEMFC